MSKFELFLEKNPAWNKSYKKDWDEGSSSKYEVVKTKRGESKPVLVKQDFETKGQADAYARAATKKSTTHDFYARKM